MSRHTPPDHPGRVSLGIAASSFPRVGMPMQMQHGEHRNEIRFCREEDAVREITNKCSPSIFFNGRKLKRILKESREDRIDLRLEAEAEARTLALVSKRRLKNLELGLGRDVEPPHLADGAETGQQLLADLGPGPGGHLPATVCREALGNHFPVPLRHRDVLRVLGEVVPERLNVFELLVRRELVKAGRRKRRLRHDPSIASATALPDPLT